MYKMNQDIDRIEIINIIKKFDSNISIEFNILPFLIFFICIIIIIVYLIKIEVNSNGKNWEKNKCSSKYVFFSGFLNNQNNDPLKQSMTNFTQCIRRYISDEPIENVKKKSRFIKSRSNVKKIDNSIKSIGNDIVSISKKTLVGKQFL